MKNIVIENCRFGYPWWHWKSFFPSKPQSIYVEPTCDLIIVIHGKKILIKNCMGKGLDKLYELV